MSTHATISIQQADGSIRSVYVHMDGGLKHTGKKLTEFYNTPEAAKALVDLGDMRYLEPNIGDVPSYHRYRGDRIKIKRYEKVEDLLWEASAEYNYVFSYKKRVWYCLATNGDVIMKESVPIFE